MKTPRPPPPASLLPVPVEASLADGLGVGAGVRWIHMGTGVPAIGQATVEDVAPAWVQFEMEQPGPFAVGARLVVEAHGRRQRWIVTVTRVAGRSVTARLASAPPPERREYPRLQGILAVRYASSPGAEAAAGWLGGGPLLGAVRTPAPRMEFSVTGLAFDDDPAATGRTVCEGDRLLIELGVGRDPRRWPCVGRVIRVLPLAGALAPSAIHRIAVEFDQIPEAATLALVRYTLRVQEAQMEGEEEPR